MAVDPGKAVYLRVIRGEKPICVGVMVPEQISLNKGIISRVCTVHMYTVHG